MLEDPEPKQQTDQNHHQNQACAYPAHGPRTAHLLLSVSPPLFLETMKQQEKGFGGILGYMWVLFGGGGNNRSEIFYIGFFFWKLSDRFGKFGNLSDGGCV
ncbi:hypothetical protein AAC387_Pa09g1084 [Persea americana]